MGISFSSKLSYYNTEKDACDKCAIGTYQPGQGQKECIFCGENLTTLLKGMEKELDCIGKSCPFTNIVTLVCL